MSVEVRVSLIALVAAAVCVPVYLVSLVAGESAGGGARDSQRDWSAMSRELIGRTEILVGARSDEREAGDPPPDPPLSRSLGILTRLRQPSDELPDVEATTLQELSASANAERTMGSVILNESRLAFRIGAGGFYIAPTSNDWVCYVLARGTARCVSRLNHGIVAVASLNAAGEFIHGLASDDVIGVKVAIGEQSYEVEVKNNGFARQLPSGRLGHGVESVIVLYRDGSHRMLGQ